MSETPSGGWWGRIARVDLDHREIRIETPPPQTWHNFLGGRGLAASCLAPAIHRDWDDPAALVVAMAGSLAATLAPSSGSCTFMARSPLAGAVAEATAGGGFATRLKGAGLDGIILSGRTDALLGLTIDHGEATLVDAGEFAEAPVDVVTRKLGAWQSVACIGPAAEHGALFASIVIDGRHAASRGGLGLAMAAKGIKFIAIRGNRRPAVADPQGLATAREDILRLFAASPALLGAHGFAHCGTAALVDLMDARRMQPTAAFRATAFPHAAQVNAHAMHRGFAPTRHGCLGCPVRCKPTARDGRPLPDFDALSHFTALVGNHDLETAIAANERCLHLGLDPVMTASAIACRLDDEGAPTPAFLLADIERIARSASAPAPECGMAVKGVALPACDPRGAYGLALSMAVSAGGPDAMSAGALGHEILRKPVATDRFSFTGKARMVKLGEDAVAAADALGVCRLALFAASLEEYGRALTAVSGHAFGAQDLMRIGERICYQERIMNARNGFDAADDDLPPRFFVEPGSSGAGIEIPPLPREAFLAARADYYRIRGLDENGRPTEAKARELGLTWNSC